MQNSQTTLDTAAIGLSFACVAHCLITFAPILLLQSLGAAFLEDERVHYVILVLVVPTSVFALSIGFRKHGDYAVPITGVLGISTLLCVLIMGEKSVGEIGEKFLTVVGSVFVGYAHVRNFLLSRSQNRRPLDDAG